MTLWTTIQLLQLAILLGAIAAGIFFFRLRWQHAALAGLFTLPAPLFQITPGAAGFVYGVDIAGMVLLVVLASRSAREPWLERRFAFSVGTALFLLILWPAVPTLLSIADGEARDFKLIGLGLFRGLTYLAIFASALRFGQLHGQVDDLLAVSCLSFSGTCLLGLAQQSLGFDLDLWNRVRDIDPTAFTGGYGGGFMGLYRGAVGAWSAGVLAILPVVWLHRRYGWLATGLMAAIILGATVQTGSRQGIICGAVGLLLGLVMAAILVTPRRLTTIWSNLLKTGGVMLLLGGTMAYAVKDADLQEWIVFRFRSSLEEDSLLRAAINRETKAGPILEQLLGNPATLLLGTGQGTVADDVPSGNARFELVYVDSELLWVLQQGGVVQLGAYLLFLLMIVRRWLRFYGAEEFRCRVVQAAALSATSVGTVLSYGHFFLLHVQSTQAPIAYWNWALIGLGLAALVPIRLPEAAAVDEESIPEADWQTAP